MGASAVAIQQEHTRQLLKISEQPASSLKGKAEPGGKNKKKVQAGFKRQLWKTVVRCHQ